MTTTLRFIFVSNPHITNVSHEYALSTSTKDVKKQLYEQWPKELTNPDGSPVEYSRVRMIVGGQKMDDTKQLNEYPVCTPGSNPAVHVTTLPATAADRHASKKQSSCCSIQ